MPRGRSYGFINGNMIVAYGSQEALYGESLAIFMDLETPHGDFKVMDEKEIHLGIVGKFEVKPHTKQDPTHRIDLYISATKLDALIDTLKRMKNDIKQLDGT
jgi:hypothetical protein